MNFNIGDRVKRGPGWHYGYQDYVDAVPGTGTVVSEDRVSSNKRWVHVKWDSGYSDIYEVYCMENEVYLDVIVLAEPPTTLGKFFEL